MSILSQLDAEEMCVTVANQSPAFPLQVEVNRIRPKKMKEATNGM